MVEIRIEQLDQASRKIEEDGEDIHISGEPGIGKTEFLISLKSRLESQFVTVEKTVRSYDNRKELANDLLYITRNHAPKKDEYKNKTTSASGGIGPLSAGGSVDDRASDLHKLKDLTRNWAGSPLVILIDNIHNIAENKKAIREIIDELSSVLGEGVNLVTAGRVSLPPSHSVEGIHLDLFTLEETERFLKSQLDNLEDVNMKQAHKVTQGHPLYLEVFSESSDKENTLIFHENEVHDRIETRYLETLPAETEEFLRQVSLLPELDQRTVSSILDGYSQTEVDRKFRQLSRGVILQDTNLTDSGDKVYKIHELFRDFLAKKHPNPDEIHRAALNYHLNEFINIIFEDSSKSWEQSLPHSFSAKYHLGEIYETEGPTIFLEEINQLGIEYPKRGLLVIFAGITMYPTNAISLYREEQSQFNEWISNQLTNEPISELIIQIVDWGLSQFDDDPYQLSEVQVEASVDEVPVEGELFNNIDLNDEHIDSMHRSVNQMLAYFFSEENFQKEKYGMQARNQIQLYGISIDVLTELREKIVTMLLDSDLSSELEDIISQNFSSLFEELDETLLSNLDYYTLRDKSLKSGQILFDNVHEDILIDEKVLEEIAIEGGDILEDAENPVFPLFWYAVSISYFREHPVSDECFERLQNRFQQSLNARRSYEENISNPMVLGDEAAENIDFELKEGN